MLAPFAVYLTASVAILLWLASRVFEWNQLRITNNAERSRYLKALYAEIDFNTLDMEVFVRETDIAYIEVKLLSGEVAVPHITDARHTQIYRNEINLIHHVGGAYIASAVNFYGLLEKIRAQIEGVQQASFREISRTGKATVVRRIYASCEQCVHQGQLLLREMEDCYPDLGLKRKTRPIEGAGLPISDLKALGDKLSSDLSAMRGVSRRQ